MKGTAWYVETRDFDDGLIETMPCVDEEEVLEAVADALYDPDANSVGFIYLGVMHDGKPQYPPLNAEYRWPDTFNPTRVRQYRLTFIGALPRMLKELSAQRAWTRGMRLGVVTEIESFDATTGTWKEEEI